MRSKLLIVALMALLVPATVAIVEARPAAISHVTKITLIASGHAFPIPVAGGPPCSGTGVPVTLHLTGDIKHITPAQISFVNLKGTITVDGKEYKLAGGSGIYNLRSLIVELHAFVENSNNPNLLVLHGIAQDALHGPDSTGVHFLCPQSKLTAAWFLDLTDSLSLS